MDLELWGGTGEELTLDGHASGHGETGSENLLTWDVHGE